ncbi:hypothetical protein DWB85_05950 [Seongchinamella sediminis]|uniref:Uncharacterized protein n=1 Tax=Seongchinamella sediminis TaxID=2283635 RepID=A0A3L7E1B3_9GAMM|nr:hypothetical protein DWB85_05950 [Seongchinamella sediminis]
MGGAGIGKYLVQRYAGTTLANHAQDRIVTGQAVGGKSRRAEGDHPVDIRHQAQGQFARAHTAQAVADQCHPPPVVVGQALDAIAQCRGLLRHVGIKTIGTGADIRPQAPALGVETVAIEETAQQAQAVFGGSETGNQYHRLVAIAGGADPVESAPAGQVPAQFGHGQAYIQLQAQCISEHIVIRCRQR